MDTDRYCTTCGGRYGDEINIAEYHDKVCPFAHDEPGWCGKCGAELTDLGTCLNDHEDNDDD